VKIEGSNVIINEGAINIIEELHELFPTHPHIVSIGPRILRTKTSKWCQQPSCISRPLGSVHGDETQTLELKLTDQM